MRLGKAGLEARHYCGDEQRFIRSAHFMGAINALLRKRTARVGVKSSRRPSEEIAVIRRASRVCALT